MAITLPSPRLHRPRHARVRASPAVAGRSAPGRGHAWTHVLSTVVTMVVAVAATGHLVRDAAIEPGTAARGPVAVQVAGTLDTAGLFGGGRTASELTVQNVGDTAITWAWQPVVVGPRVATGALEATATLGRCGTGGASVPRGRLAPVPLPPGNETRLCVLLDLPESITAVPLDVSVRVDATPA